MIQLRFVLYFAFAILTIVHHDVAANSSSSEEAIESKDRRFINEACNDLSTCLEEKNLHLLSSWFMLGVSIFPLTYEILQLEKKTKKALDEKKRKGIRQLCPDVMKDEDFDVVRYRENCRDWADECFKEYVLDIIYPNRKGRSPEKPLVDQAGDVVDGEGEKIYYKWEFFPGAGSDLFTKETPEATSSAHPTRIVPVRRRR
ncbi:uncharacterized protein LOC126847739 [Adelges cooleyi]|uniref:uncharacterized protein LOC126847739 n=1 Tax=Adelges cooleyi TaxID=133065 RepID=UPI0021807232|nr:uncharacterized protein LOC126847739 [Adelges cooleyi]